MLPADRGVWDFPDMADADDLRGKALYDALMRLKPDGLAETEWASRAGVNRGFFSNIKNAPISPRMDTVRKLLSNIGRTDADLRAAARGDVAPVADQPAVRTVDAGETAPVVRLDLSYSMGPGTDLDSSYIDGEAFQFDIGFLRSLTITPPDRLRIVDGVGTSMEPTFHDRDLLLIDINQRDLNAQDRVWACWIFGLGAVKRLRAVGPDRVLVMSDNPGVDNQEVSRADIIIHGRVVGSIKRH